MTSPVRRIFQIAAPTIVGNLLFSLVGLAAIKAVGEIGASSVAAVVSAERVLLFIQAALFLVVGGTATLVAQYWGAGRKQDVITVIRTSLALSTVISLFLILFVLLFSYELVAMFGLDEAIGQKAEMYVLTVALFTIFLSIARTLATGLRSTGDAMTPVWVLSLVNVCSIPLIFALVLGHWGMPKLGIEGAAIAVGVSHTASAFIFFVLWRTGRTRINNIGGSYWDFGTARRLLSTGYPVAAEQALFHLGSLLAMYFVGLFDERALAAYGIGIALMAIAYMVGFGFSTAATTLVGQALGAGDQHLAKRSTMAICVLSIAIMVVVGLLVQHASREIGTFFVADPQVAEHFTVFATILAFALPLMAIEFSLVGALRGAGDTRSTMIISGTSILIARLVYPAICIQLGLGVEWIFGVVVVDYAIKSVLYVRRCLGESWLERAIA